MISKRNVIEFCGQDISLIENYELAFNSNDMWDCHHRLEELGFSKKDLVYLGLYYKVPADELIFLSHKDHTTLHMNGNKYAKGRIRDEKFRKDVGARNIGNKHCLGRKWVNKDGVCKTIKQEEIENYLSDGWELGRKNATWMKGNKYGADRKWINKEGKTKMVFTNEIENYLSDGWKLGRNKIK